MDADQEKVHHAIVELYEVEDAESVTASDVCNHTGMQLHSVLTAMGALEKLGMLERDEFGNVVMVKNNDYYPTTLLEQVTTQGRKSSFYGNL